ncbi:DUF29 domain-containing protein [Anabaena sp. FACHB-1237]|nr:DUF29 domain-containing protein [Anabaena sp. FACHB-1237]
MLVLIIQVKGTTAYPHLCPFTLEEILDDEFYG